MLTWKNRIFDTTRTVGQKPNRGMSDVAGSTSGTIFCWSNRFIKHVDFIGNSADAHGGAIATTYPNIEFLPQDATYEGNVLQNVRNGCALLVQTRP